MVANSSSGMEDKIGSLRGVDIYLLDQIFKNRIPINGKILDAGCGGGRNTQWLIENGYDVTGIDINPSAVESFKSIVGDESKALHGDLSELPFDDQQFDVVLCVAVLHFSDSTSGFQQMMTELGRVLAPGGMFFARLATDIGIEQLVRPVGDRVYMLPDGSQRYLANEEMLHAETHRMNGRLLEPIKTTNVQNLRCMTTWVVRKAS